jgi:hypothetical protein
MILFANSMKALWGNNMNALLNPSPSTKRWYRDLGIAGAIAFFMILTRGSHVVTPLSLPDASLVLFLLGGMYLARVGWFFAFFILGTLIDFGAAALDPAQGFCLTNGYWGFIPTYGAMWFGGRWLANRSDPFALIPYMVVALLTTAVAFVISTQTYYLFSGRFPNDGIMETIQHGWNYFPSYMAFTVMYFAIVWLVAKVIRGMRFKPTIQAQ